jgi:hypothetical protein
MKDVVLHEGILEKFISYFLELQFLGYEFSKLDDGSTKSKISFFYRRRHAGAGLRGGGRPCWGGVIAARTNGGGGERDGAAAGL